MSTKLPVWLNTAKRVTNLGVHYGNAFKYPLVMFGACLGGAACYFTEWRVIVDYIPYYNSKFMEEKKS